MADWQIETTATVIPTIFINSNNDTVAWANNTGNIIVWFTTSATVSWNCIETPGVYWEQAQDSVIPTIFINSNNDTVAWANNTGNIIVWFTTSATVTWNCIETPGVYWEQAQDSVIPTIFINSNNDTVAWANNTGNIIVWFTTAIPSHWVVL